MKRLFLFCGLSFALLGACFASDHKVVDDGVVIENVTLISSERAQPLEHISVVIRKGRIVEIAPGVVAGPHGTRIDGRNRFLIPGLIDSHVHLGDLSVLGDGADSHPELVEAFRAQVPRSFLAFGFTTVVDLNLAKDTLSWFNAAPLHPNVYHCGPALHTAGGYGAQRIAGNAAAADAANVIYEKAQAKYWPAGLEPRDYTPARAVERVAAAGGICVKVFDETGFGGIFHWPVPSAETLAAIRTETRKRGLVMLMHANAVESWRDAINAHADVIAHGLWHWPGDRFTSLPPAEAADVVHAAAVAGVAVQPTTQVLFGELSIFDRSLLNDPRFAEAVPPAVVAYLKTEEAQAAAKAQADQYRQAFASFHPPASMDFATVLSIAPARVMATLRLMKKENVKLLFGTDTPSGDGGIGNPPGVNGRLEMTHWMEAGLTPAQLLRAATIDNAKMFGLAKELGTIEVGKRADLLLLDADPLKSVDAYDKIKTVFLNGKPIPRTTLLASH